MQKKQELGKKNMRKFANEKKKLVKQMLQSDIGKYKQENEKKDGVIVAAFSLFVIFFITTLGLGVDKFVWGWI